jgi:hypothetical protein
MMINHCWERRRPKLIVDDNDDDEARVGGTRYEICNKNGTCVVTITHNGCRMADGGFLKEGQEGGVVFGRVVTRNYPTLQQPVYKTAGVFIIQQSCHHSSLFKNNVLL